jgi:hypothetical protein
MVTLFDRFDFMDIWKQCFFDPVVVIINFCNLYFVKLFYGPLPEAQ